MASKTKVEIKLLSAGITELLCSAGAQGACEEAAEGVAARAGDGFEVLPAKRMGFGGGRVGVSVCTATKEAREAEATDKVLTNAVRG